MKSLRPTLNAASPFVAIRYFIDWKPFHLEVDGFAFETPGWPNFHACVRYGNRMGDGLFDDWILDHFETGLALSDVGKLNCKEDAPAALAKFLNSKGRRKVLAKMLSYGVRV